MTAEKQQSPWKRWSFWLVVALAVWLPVATGVLLWHAGTGFSVTEAKGGQIAPGMTRAEVEALLGAPNPLPDLAQRGEAFWDDNAVLGFRYVSIHITFAADGRVMHTRVKGSWRGANPSWKFW